jgi:hypothetical protein
MVRLNCFLSLKEWKGRTELFSETLRKELTLRGRLNLRAAQYPGSHASPYVPHLKVELTRTCEWSLSGQNQDGVWPMEKKALRFYAEGYVVRSLVAAAGILGVRRYQDAAVKWAEYMVRNQRADGGFWTGYSWGDHDFDGPDEDKTVVYLADAGELGLALIAVYHALDGKEGNEKTCKAIRTSLLRFRTFCDQFRLSSGAIGLGYTERDFYRPPAGMRNPRPFMQAHYAPFPFATAVTGVAFHAALYTVTQDPADWRKAMKSLDWCLENSVMCEGTSQLAHGGAELDFKHLHRALDIAFASSPSPAEKAQAPHQTPEPRFASPERQKLYSLWKYCLHLFAEVQSDLGEWSLRTEDHSEIALHTGALRHRLYPLYSLVTYLGTIGAYPKEDDALVEACGRQLWLCTDPVILDSHYGVCAEIEDLTMMPTGLWGMTLCELLQPGTTLPRRAASGRGIAKEA